MPDHRLRLIQEDVDMDWSKNWTEVAIFAVQRGLATILGYEKGYPVIQFDSRIVDIESRPDNKEEFKNDQSNSLVVV